MEDQTEELRRRREAALTRKRAADAKRAELEASREGELEVERLELEAANAEAVADAEADHDPRKIRVVESGLGVVIVRRPNPLLYKRFRDKGEAKTNELEKLVRGCLLYPTAAGFDRILEEEPGTLDRCATAVIELAGFRLKEASGK